jgi:hypothetical protein
MTPGAIALAPAPRRGETARPPRADATPVCSDTLAARPTGTIDSQNIAVLLRGGMLPQASVDPAAMRATRDRLRRRMHLMRQRAEWLTHVPQTTHPYNLSAFSTNLAYQANRDGLAARFVAPAVQKTIEVDLALMGSYAQLLNDVALSMVRTAKPPAPATFYPRQSVPGIGKLLRLVRLYEIHDIRRFPRVQDVMSYGRLVTCAQASAGKRDGASGTTMGHASLTWAFSDAAVLFLRDNPAGHTYRTRRAKTHGTGKALTVLAHQ